MKTPTPFAPKGSQRWLQITVNQQPELLNKPLRQSGGWDPKAEVEWLSPIEQDGFCEYRDQACLKQLGLNLQNPLADFWPARGPVWDGLARIGRDALLVEAKAHIPEMISPASRATGASKATIDKSLRTVQRALAPKATIDWSGIFYQYANRVAFLYFLREINKLPAHLVFVYFLNASDVSGPSTRDEWTGAIRLVEGYLGITRHRLSRYIHKVFVDIRQLAQ
jgi:hypothetical protein